MGVIINHIIQFFKFFIIKPPVDGLIYCNLNFIKYIFLFIVRIKKIVKVLLKMFLFKRLLFNFVKIILQLYANYIYNVTKYF